MIAKLTTEIIRDGIFRVTWYRYEPTCRKWYYCMVPLWPGQLEDVRQTIVERINWFWQECVDRDNAQT